VYMFTRTIQNSSFALSKDMQRDRKLSVLLSEGVESCVKLRQSRDIYEEQTWTDHKQTQVLFIISLSMLMNILYHVYNYHIGNDLDSKDFWAKNLVLLAAWALFLGLSLGTGIGDRWSWFEVTVMHVLMLVVGVYYEVFFLEAEQYRSKRKPSVHPVIFGVVYYCLSSYVVIEKGVTSLEVLLVECIKSFAMAWIYTKIVLFYSNDAQMTERQILVHRAQLIAIFVLGFMSFDMCSLPYVNIYAFDMICLLPFFWVMVCIGENVIFDIFEIGYGNPGSTTQNEYVDIRRNVIFTGGHILLFWVTSHLFSEVTQFMDIHQDVYKYTNPLDNRFILKNKNMMPGYVREF